MKTIMFECEIITPMFLAGADGRYPEIRPSSIKGSLRFWWRAMNGNLDIKELRRQEENIFGCGGKVAKRSNVIVRTTHPVWNDNFYEYLLPHKQKAKSKAFNVGQKFVVFLSLSIENYGFNISMLESLFVLVCLLGGFGKRSRRGFGSVRILKKDGEEFGFPKCSEDLVKCINTINNDYIYDPLTDQISLRFLSKYTCDYPYIKEIVIGNKVYSADELVKMIGESSHLNVTCANGCDSPRFASPTYVSAIKADRNNDSKEKYYPVVTSLQFAPPAGIVDDVLKKQEFKRRIIDKY